MKKWNVILGIVLALIVMFNVGVVVYNSGYANGIDAWSNHVKTQEELKVKNELKTMFVSSEKVGH